MKEPGHCTEVAVGLPFAFDKQEHTRHIFRAKNALYELLSPKKGIFLIIQKHKQACQ